MSVRARGRDRGHRPRRSGRRSPPRRAASAGWRSPRARSTSRSADAPHRLVWWWGARTSRPRASSSCVVRRARPGTRVVVTESAPAFPLASLAAASTLVRRLERRRSAASSPRWPTRRGAAMVETLLRDGTTSVPALTAALPITRQAVAKHLATLERRGARGARCPAAAVARSATACARRARPGRGLAARRRGRVGRAARAPQAHRRAR